MSGKKVAYIHHGDYIRQSDRYIPTQQRNAMVHSLIQSCGLLNEMVKVIPRVATTEDLAGFHCKQYLAYLQRHNDVCSDDESDNDEEGDSFGVRYDCPLTPGIVEYCKRIGGGSISAASLLCNQQCNIAIHWLGGWHHAHRAAAAGWCYVNDCVLAILKLRERFPRVLYVDIDVHHGDGVEEAFMGTHRVLTFSVHKYEPGFFPGTGSLRDQGVGKGRGYALNLPLKEGIQDGPFVDSVQRVLAAVKTRFRPDAVMCQFGADGLNNDPMQSFNLTHVSFTALIKYIMSWELPLLLLGGGGYNEANVARCWTQVTAAVLGRPLPDDIPEEDPFFLGYSPTMEFTVDKGCRKDSNTPEYLNATVKSLLERIENINVS